MILRRRIMVTEAAGEDFVDLGLPSGLLWGVCNIGATTPEGVGLYFSKGNIEGHEYGDGSSFNSSAYANTTGASVTGDVPANSTYDAARAILGGAWRLPTKDEFKELVQNTDNEYSSLNGRNGWKFMKKSDHSVFVFFPAAGRYAYEQSFITGFNVSCMYWASTKHQNTQWYCLYFNDSYVQPENTAIDYSGFQIRGVCKPMFSITITLTGDSVSGITVTVTDSEGISHSGTTDSNGVVRLSGVASGSATISAVEYVFTPYSINVNSSSRTFTIGCEYTVVDLGLQSGLLWAKGNLVKDSNGNYAIGAETDWGTYVSWGNIIGHNEGEGYDFSYVNYNSTPGHSVAANIPSNDAAHDIALATLGTPWHLPTKEDCQELVDNTDSELTTINGVSGRKFMKKSDHSVFVFFPASGHYDGTSLNLRGTHGLYWSSSFDSSSNAYNLYLSRSKVLPRDNSTRRYGFTVRPVFNP